MKEKQTKEQFMTRSLTVWFGALVCCLLWGSAFPSIKIGYQLMNISSDQTSAQILYAGCRFFLAGGMVILIGSVTKRKKLVPTRKELPKIALLSLFQTILQYLFFYIGLANTSGVKASIITGMNVFVAILFAAYVFHQERITTRKMLGCFIGFLGVVLVNLTGNGLDGGFALNGEGFIFLSTIAYAVSSALIKNFSQKHDPVLFSGYQFLFGGAVMIVFGILMGGSFSSVSAPAVGMLIYLAFISAAAYTLWGILLKYNPVSRVAVFGFMNPVFGVILSALFLNEGDMLSFTSGLALLLVCAGIYIVNREKQ